MSRGPENTFIASIHKHLPDDLYSMKNHNEYNGGIPDCWYSGRAGDLWVEYKFIELPKRASTLIQPFKELTPLQRDWIWNRTREGRHVWLVIGCGEGGVITGPKHLEHGLIKPVWEARPSFTKPGWTSMIESRKDIAAQIVQHCKGNA